MNVHDYPHDAVGRAVPYVVYDVTTNRGFIYLGTSGDTPAFAVDAIAAWWPAKGRTGYPPGIDQLLVLADAAGSNGCRIRAWKERLQVQICDRFGRAVTVCHYPTGCSKPVESNRAQIIQSDQPQLGRSTPADLGHRDGFHSWHNDSYWTGSAGYL